MSQGTDTALPPLHMRRRAFDPTPELGQIRDAAGVQTVTNAFGVPVYLVTRYEDVLRVLKDEATFSKAEAVGVFSLPEPFRTRFPEGLWINRTLSNRPPADHMRMRRIADCANASIRSGSRIRCTDHLPKPGPMMLPRPAWCHGTPGHCMH